MKDIVNIFKSNRSMIESFIVATIENVEIEKLDRENADNLFSSFKSLDLIYFADRNWHQASLTYLRNSDDGTLVGTKKLFLSTRIKLKDNGTVLSNPYINSYTGRLTITYVKRVPEGYMVFDFSLMTMLSRLKLVETSYRLKQLNTIAYGFMGAVLVVFAFFLSFYSLVEFWTSIFPVNDISLEGTFKAIIALTLGLAIFDLAKTILEQEVFNRQLVENRNQQNRVFSKFLISIIIALSIESLMVVFKIAISDYHDMIYALYLIIGVAAMIIALAIHNRFNSNQEKNI